jgi:hypothetical protein
MTTAYLAIAFGLWAIISFVIIYMQNRAIALLTLELYTRRERERGFCREINQLRRTVANVADERDGLRAQLDEVNRTAAAMQKTMDRAEGMMEELLREQNVNPLEREE